MHIEAVTFFRSDELSRHPVTIPAQTYNHIRLLLNRSATDCQFVPIRTLQYMAVITRQEVIFVDSLNYRVQDGEGGRMIMMAWEFGQQESRDSLSEPLLIDVVHYCKNMGDVELRLYREFDAAMQQLLDQQFKENDIPKAMKVVSLSNVGETK